MADHVNNQFEMTSNLTVKPYWQNFRFSGHEPDESGPDRTTGKRIAELINFYFEFSVLGPRGRPFYWKSHRCEFHEYILSFCKISARDGLGLRCIMQVTDQ